MSKPWEEEWETCGHSDEGLDVRQVGTRAVFNMVVDDDTAKFVAAAPDLYRALSTLVAWHANVGGCKMTALHECMDAAIDALKKARGET